MPGLDELIKSLESAKPVTKQAQDARAKDYLDSRGVETSTEKLARIKAEDKMRPRTAREIEDARLKSEKERLLDQASIIESKSKIKASTTRPISGVKGEKLGIIEDTGAKIEDLSYRPKLTRPQKMSLDTYQNMAKTSADTLDIIAQAEKYPGRFGTDFNKISQRIARGNIVAKEFATLRDTKLQEAIQKLPPDKQGNQYYLQLLASNIDKLAADNLSKAEGEDINVLLEERDFLMNGNGSVIRYKAPAEQETPTPQPTPVPAPDYSTPVYSETTPTDAVLTPDEGVQLLKELNRMESSKELTSLIRDLGEASGIAAEGLTESRNKTLSAKEKAMYEIYDTLKANFSADEIKLMSTQLSQSPPKRTTGSTWRAQS